MFWSEFNESLSVFVENGRDLSYNSPLDESDRCLVDELVSSGCYFKCFDAKTLSKMDPKRVMMATNVNGRRIFAGIGYQDFSTRFRDLIGSFKELSYHARLGADSFTNLGKVDWSAVLGEKDNCAICHERIEEKEDLSLLSCKHLFHYQCLLDVIKVTSQYNCPCCRLPFKDNSVGKSIRLFEGQDAMRRG